MISSIILERSAKVEGDTDLKRLLKKSMKFVNTRHFFWHQQIPTQTKPKLFKVKRDGERRDEGRAVEADEAKAIATKQLVTVLEGVLL